MAGKYQITAKFDLETRIEPDGVRFDTGHIDAEEVSDDSRWSDTDVESNGGHISFVIEADSEEDAEARSTDLIYEGYEVDDSSGFTWTVSNVSVEVEEIEPPMDAERAKALIGAYLDRETSAGRIDGETREAFEFVLNLIPVA